MHKQQMYESLRDMLEQEVAEIEKKGSLDAQSLDHLYKLMVTLTKTDKCIEREEGGASFGYSRGYSQGMMSRDNFRGNSYRGGSYDGRSYNERSYDGRSYNERSYDGRSYDKENSRQKIMSRLNMLMDEATNENERQAIMECMNNI